MNKIRQIVQLESSSLSKFFQISVTCKMMMRMVNFSGVWPQAVILQILTSLDCPVSGHNMFTSCVQQTEGVGTVVSNTLDTRDAPEMVV